MSSPVSSNPDPALAAGMIQPPAGRPSYESFLRVKQGIGSEALRAAGLPAAEHLSYDAYVAALNRKAAETRAAEMLAVPRMPAAETGAKADRTDAKRIAWASLVVVPVATVFVLLVADMFKERPDGVALPSASEAVAAPLTGEGLPVALAVTTMDEMPALIPPAEEAPASLDIAGFDHETAALPPATDRVEMLPAPKTAAAALPVAALPAADSATKPAEAPLAKKKAAAAPRELAKVTGKPQKATAKPVRQSAEKPNGFWQPLVDILNGKIERGTYRLPPPKDRSGR